MDIYEEYMVEKKKTVGNYLGLLGTLVGIFVVLMLLPVLFRGSLVSLVTVVVVGGIYLLYHQIMGMNLEYEYCFTNGMMDVDKIIGKKNRKKIVEINARNIEKMALLKTEEGRGYLKDKGIKKAYACTHAEDEGVYYILFEGRKGRSMLLFNPNEAIAEGFRKYNPKRVFLS